MTVKKLNTLQLSLFVLVIFLLFNNIVSFSQSLSPDTLRNISRHEFHQVVTRDRLSAQRWWYGWLAGYSAATVAQGAVAIASGTKSTRQDMVLGAATTLFGAVGVLITPVVPEKDTWQTKPDSASGSASLASDVRMLKEIARLEKEGRSWKMHALTGAFNIGSGLVTWLGFKRTVKDGLINFAINSVITEAQIWSQPVKAVKDYKKYCEAGGTVSNLPRSKPETKVYLCSYPGGFSVLVNF